MFESICVRRQNIIEAETVVDLGLLAEAMLFYRRSRVIADYAILKQLINACSPNILLELLESGFLQITYFENQIGIATYDGNTSKARYEPVRISPEKRGLDTVLQEFLIEETGHSGQGRRLAKRFSRHIEVQNFETNILRETYLDYSDTEYIGNAAIKLIQKLAPEYKQAQDVVFNVSYDESYLRVETNIDFLELNKVYHRHIPPSHSTLDVAHILVYVMDARVDLSLAAAYSAELATNSINADIIQLKFDSLLRKRERNEAQIARFQDFVFDESRAIREAINSGRRTFQDLLSVLESSKKFSHWLEGHEVNADLVKSYFREVTKSSWIDKLPSKSVRWTIFQTAGVGLGALAAGGLGIAGGIVLGAVDTFFLDKLLKGWKPNQFVEGSLKDFVSDKT